jgi:hypothetical protein
MAPSQPVRNSRGNILILSSVLDSPNLCFGLESHSRLSLEKKLLKLSPDLAHHGSREHVVMLHLGSLQRICVELVQYRRCPSFMFYITVFLNLSY